MHILGAGGHAKVIVEILQDCREDTLTIWDDTKSGLTFMGYTVEGGFNAFKKLNTDQVIIAIGNNLSRKQIASQIPASAVSAIHPTSYISKTAKIGGGAAIMPHASVNANAILGKHVIINTNASVDHDCRLGDFVHVSPQAGLAGNITVGEGTHIGIGASIIQNIKIGKWATIGAGAVIINDVPDYAVVVGNPGRIIKYNSPV